MTIILTIILLELDTTIKQTLSWFLILKKHYLVHYTRRPDCKMISLENKVYPLKRLFEKYHFNGFFTGENDF